MSPFSVLAQASDIPGDSGGPYVIAAYVVFLVMVVVYVAIMAQRLQKIARTADDLERRLDGLDHAQHQGAGAVQPGDGPNAAEPPTIAPAAPLEQPTTSAGGPSA